jgi:hypothetical protein
MCKIGTLITGAAVSSRLVCPGGVSRGGVSSSDFFMRGTGSLFSGPSLFRGMVGGGVVVVDGVAVPGRTPYSLGVKGGTCGGGSMALAVGYGQWVQSGG